MALNSTIASPTFNISAPSTSQCIVLQFQDFIPWNNEDNIISFETEDLIRRLNFGIVLPILFLIGVPANVINMAVFRKQGLKERINVCMFALSLADCLYLMCNMMWHGEQVYVQFTTKAAYGPILQWMANHNIVGFAGFTWVSQILSAIIASERCFCILQPLRSHTILKTSTTTVIIIVVFLVVVGFHFIVVSRYYVVCAYDPLADSFFKTAIPSQFYHRHKNLVDFLDVFVYGAGIPVTVIVVVTSTTIVTSVKLRQAAKWRAETSSRGGDGGGGDGGGLSLGEIALTRMLVFNSVFFIICVFPVCLFWTTLPSMPEMGPGMRHHNFFMSGLWILHGLCYINATFNFLIYYTMGSRYRQTLRSLPCFACCKSAETHKG